VKTSLLLTQSRDPTADYIQIAFKRNKKPISRINLDDFFIPKLSIDPLQRDNGWIEDSKGKKVKVNNVEAIILRRPSIPNLHEDEAKNRFLSREILFGLRAFLEATSAIWMNHPDSNSVASSKPRNLWLASSLGLKVPQTFLSSDPIEISTWLKGQKKSVIKAISYGLIEGKNSAEMAFTQRIPKSFNVDENIIPGVPIFLQEEIEKEADIRVTIVGNKVFSAILVQEGDQIDWRVRGSDAKWEPYKLPKSICNACTKLCNELQLEFAAIDLVKSISGDYFFLELNPSGQWVWIEEETGLPISDAIVDRLSNS
jgi:glutathione synthase/RimK-type ligase-like ATP-grasp enzyme